MSADNELTFDRCPICGGGIQATSEVYLVNLMLDKKGDVVDDGEDSGCYGETTIYCENDHTHEEMINCINGEMPIHPDAKYRSPWED